MKKPTLDSVFKKAKSTVRKAWSQAGYYAEDDQTPQSFALWEPASVMALMLIAQ